MRVLRAVKPQRYPHRDPALAGSFFARDKVDFDFSPDVRLAYFPGDSVVIVRGLDKGDSFLSGIVVRFRSPPHRPEELKCRVSHRFQPARFPS
jgi:hypothetical protein